MNRALIDRSNSISNLPEGYSLTRPEILQSKLQFRDSKLAKNPDSIDNNDLLDDGLIACPNCKYDLHDLRLYFRLNF